MRQTESRTGRALAGGRHQGQTLLEVLVALAILATVIVGATKLVDIYAQQTRAAVTAEQVSNFGAAANAYIRDNYAALEAVATATTPALIRVPTLTATGYLTSGFTAQNSYGQSVCVLVLQPTSGQLNALVVTEGGTAINDLDLGQIAGIVGGAGGGVYSTSTSTLTGAMGGWATPIGNFANANSSGQHCNGTAGTVSISAGHPVEALWFAGGDQTAGVLYRNAIPGQPSRNTMNTPIVMSASTIETAGAACSSTGAIARDASGRVLACQNGSWQYNGSYYWADPVAAYANLPTTDPVGTVRMVTSLGRTFTWTGSAWAALAVDQNGNLSVPGTLFAGNASVSGNAWISGSTITNALAANNASVAGVTSTGEAQVNTVVAANTACSPNGLVARDSNGLLLSCQNGIWKDAGGSGGGLIKSYVQQNAGKGFVVYATGGPWYFGGYEPLAYFTFCASCGSYGQIYAYGYGSGWVYEGWFGADSPYLNFWSELGTVTASITSNGINVAYSSYQASTGCGSANMSYYGVTNLSMDQAISNQSVYYMTINGTVTSWGMC